MWFLIGIACMFGIVEAAEVYDMPPIVVAIFSFLAGAVFIMADTITTINKSMKRRGKPW